MTETVIPHGRCGHVDGRPIALDALLGYVAPRLRVNVTKPVILHADSRASYQQVIRVYDELCSSERRTGVRIRNLAIPTEREIREYIEILGYDPFAKDGS